MAKDVVKLLSVAPLLLDLTHTYPSRFCVSRSSTSSESSSEYDSPKKKQISPKYKRHRRYCYIDKIFPHYSDLDFQHHFKMTRGTVEVIITNFGKDWKKFKGRTPIPFEKSLLLTLWYLVTSENYREVGKRFNLSKGHIQRIIVKVCIIIHSRRMEYVKWPQGIKLESTIEKFNTLFGSDSFPNVVACIRVTDMKIESPQVNESYCDNHGTYSIKVQATCVTDLLFTHVYIGWPGVAQDDQIWKSNPLHNYLREKIPLDATRHMLGDGGYPIASYLMVPYKDLGILSSSQILFNERLNNTRVCIDKAFGRLKDVFTRLSCLKMHKLENVKFVVMTCFVLHNINVMNRDTIFTQNGADCGYNMDQFSDENGVENILDTDFVQGMAKREKLCNFFSNGF